METAQPVAPPSRTWALVAIIAMLSRAAIFGAVVATEAIAVFTIPDWNERALVGDLIGELVTLGLGGGVALDIVVFAVAAVAFLVWLRGAMRYAHAQAPPHPNVSAGHAIGSWFIPVVSWFAPYKVVQSLHRVSAAHVADSDSDWARRWPWLLPLWWVSWLVSITLNNISFRMWEDDRVSVSATWVGLVAAPLVLISACCAAAILWSIQTNHQRLAAARSKEETEFRQFQPPDVSRASLP